MESLVSDDEGGTGIAHRAVRCTLALVGLSILEEVQLTGEV